MFLHNHGSEHIFWIDFGLIPLYRSVFKRRFLLNWISNFSQLPSVNFLRNSEKVTLNSFWNKIFSTKIHPECFKLNWYSANWYLHTLSKITVRPRMWDNKNMVKQFYNNIQVWGNYGTFTIKEIVFLIYLRPV